MNLSQMILPEFDHEMANTRKTLERVPEDNLDWQPHAKSMTLQRLTSHLAEVPSWGAVILTREELDLGPPGGSSFKPSLFGSREEWLKAFDGHVAATRVALAAASDEELNKDWTLKSGGAVIFSEPRIAVFRGMILNHNVHHRGQLTVYLRLRNVPVPALYGPSADEGIM
jgi:uncharacterized damage-inducible protein DinB